MALPGERRGGARAVGMGVRGSSWENWVGGTSSSSIASDMVVVVDGRCNDMQWQRS